jgi:hypothetical protein
MRKNFRVAILGTGMLSLLMGASAFAAQTRLDAFVARLKGLDAAGRKAAMKSLTPADRKALHAEYRALPAGEKAAVNAALGRGKARASAKGKTPKGGIGTVQYDTGVRAPFRDNFGSVVGNNFNTGFGNPHTISVATFSMNGTFANTPVRIYGAPAGTVAPVLASFFFSGLPINQLVTWDINPNIVGHNGQFLGGVEQSGSFSSINSTFVGVNIDVNNGGQGFHGMNINLSGNGFNPNATASGQPFNTIFRATGNNLPVELMGFDVQ